MFSLPWHFFNTWVMTLRFRLNDWCVLRHFSKRPLWASNNWTVHFVGVASVQKALLNGMRIFTTVITFIPLLTFCAEVLFIRFITLIVTTFVGAMWSSVAKPLALGTIHPSVRSNAPRKSTVKFVKVRENWIGKSHPKRPLRSINFFCHPVKRWWM